MTNFPWLIVAVVWFVNLFISWLNARTVGLMWVETKEIGGWQRFMAWMGAIMSASGFSWCYLIILLLGGYYAQFSFIREDHLPWISSGAVRMGFALGCLLILPGVLFSGMMIWIDSLIQAWRRRDLPSMAVAAWNTYAQVHNTYGAMRGIPEAFGEVSGFFKGGDSKDKGGLIVIVLVICALLAGVLTTWAIVYHYAGSRPLPERPE